MARRLLLISFIILLFIPGKSQDPVYSQFFNNPLYYNPAFVGISDGMQVRTNYRKQWPNLPGDYNSYNVSLDIASRELPGAGGIGLMIDKHNAGAGYFESIKIGIPISVRIPLAEDILIQMGIMTSFTQKSIDWNSLVFMDQLDPRFGNVYPTSFTAPTEGTITYPDFDIGLALRWFTVGYKGMEYIFTTGVSVQHVLNPNESFFDLEAKLPKRLVVSGDVIIQNEYFERPFSAKRKSRFDFRVNPGFMFEMQQDFKAFTFGLNAYKSNLYAGAWYRAESFDFTKTNAAVFMGGITTHLSDEIRMKFMYSYDMLLSKTYSRAAGGTHELSIIFEFSEFSLISSTKPKWSRRKTNYNFTPF